jgi:ethanolamine utilization protein EutA (predicted chaperonin)
MEALSAEQAQAYVDGLYRTAGQRWQERVNEGEALTTYAPHAPVVLAFDQDLANTVGRAVAARVAGRLSLLCVEELTLGELDYLDLGEPLPGETYVPVVVKSLIFAG